MDELETMLVAFEIRTDADPGHVLDAVVEACERLAVAVDGDFDEETIVIRLVG